MHTKLIEIVPDTLATEESWADWATRNVKENGWKVAGAAVVIAPVVPVGVGAIAVGAGIVSGVQNGVAWLRGQSEIEQVQLSNSILFKDEHDRPLQVNRYYAIHPDDKKNNLVILASEFHDVIVSEQIADLVSFIRGAARTVSIRIEVESERSGKAGGSFFPRFSASAEGGVAKRHSVELRYDNPKIIDTAGRPFWLYLFPEIVAAFKGATKGYIKRNVSVDTTFGLNASLAEQAGIDINWLEKQRFTVEAQFV